MSTGEPVDIAGIVEHSRAIFRAGLVTRGPAVDALRLIEETLRCEHACSDEELSPIIQLIIEITAEG
jgi:hypothetical protein